MDMDEELEGAARLRQQATAAHMRANKLMRQNRIPEACAECREGTRLEHEALRVDMGEEEPHG